MTKVVTITRHHSGFDNVADSYEIGDHDSADTSVERYQLPAGYWLDRERGVVIDPDGYDCAVLPIEAKGEPQLRQPERPSSQCVARRGKHQRCLTGL